MGSIIISIIILLFVAGILYGVYCMAGKAVNGVPLALIGIGLLLILLLVGLWLFGALGSSPFKHAKLGMHQYRIVHAFKPIRPDCITAIAYRKT